MTSLAFVFGVLPLAISNGAGSGSQHAIGTGVIGGMLSATLLAIFFVPLFFVLVERIFKPKHPGPQERGHDAAVAQGGEAPSTEAH
jgi:multidrug efflux pump